MQILSNTSKLKFLIEEDHSLPICQIQIVLRTGAAVESTQWPIGLVNFASELMRRGAAGQSRIQLDEALDSLGASLDVYCGQESVIFKLVSLTEKLPQAVKILADVLLRPDFSLSEAERLQRELLSNLENLRENDHALVGRFFAKFLYGNHAYGRPIDGTKDSIAKLSVDLAKQWYAQQLLSGNIIIAAAGDITMSHLEEIFYNHFSDLQIGLRQDTPPLEPLPVQGKQLFIIDKPERTQSQILFGQLAPKWAEPDWLPLHVATTVFGGMFTARLMTEVRVKRGLSYGANAQIGSGRGRQALMMHVFPAAEQTAETIELVSNLYEEWANQGITPEELLFAKSYLKNSYAFELQTPESRLRLRIKHELCGMPPSRISTMPQMIEEITLDQAQTAIKQHVRPETLLITLVATKTTVQADLQNLESFREGKLTVVPYDSF